MLLLLLLLLLLLCGSMAAVEYTAQGVCEACRALLHPCSTPEQRAAADAYLSAMSRPRTGADPAAVWGVLTQIVAANHHHGQAPLEPALRCFAAQAMRAHAQRGRAPPPAEMACAALRLLSAERPAALADHDTSQSRGGGGGGGGGRGGAGERPVLTQLCLAAVAAAARAKDWAVGEVLPRLTAELLRGVELGSVAVSQTVVCHAPQLTNTPRPAVVVIAPLRGRCAQAACTLLELVRLVPEELEEKRLSMSPQRRKALLAVLREEGSAGLARWLAGACAAEEGGGGVTAAQAAELWRAAFGCLHSWLRAELVPEPLLRSTPLLGLALRTLLLPPHAAEERDDGGGAGAGAGAGAGGGLLRIGYRCRSTLDAAREAAADVICAAVAARDGGGEVVRQLLAHVDALSAAALPPREDGAQPPAAAAASAGGAQRRGACRVLVALGAATAPDLARLEGGAPVSRACPSWIGPCWLRLTYVTPVLIRKLRMVLCRRRRRAGSEGRCCARWVAVRCWRQRAGLTVAAAARGRSWRG
eukprot:COSAG01_NODE_13_length_41723_cov_145.394556_4_plen_531_part_00